MSPYATSLHAVLNYQCRVNAVLLDTTRPKGSHPGKPMLDPDEVAAMDRAMSLGTSPEAFAAVLAHRDREAATGRGVA
jgi:hypothetical protein